MNDILLPWQTLLPPRQTIDQPRKLILDKGLKQPSTPLLRMLDRKTRVKSTVSLVMSCIYLLVILHKVYKPVIYFICIKHPRAYLYVLYARGIAWI